MIEIIPAIDIIDGKCVRLSQGDYSRKTVYRTSPVEMARRLADTGIKRLHIVDLDGAKAGKPANLDVMHRIASLNTLKIEWGGGIKSRDSLNAVLDAGADYPVIGSIAAKQPGLMEEWLEEFSHHNLILGADLRNGKVAVNGWLEDTPLTINDLMERFVPHGLKEVICTDISKDGMLQGPSTAMYTSLADRYRSVTFTVSGGISSMNDIKELDRLNLPRVIVGKAIYEGLISLTEIQQFIERQCLPNE